MLIIKNTLIKKNFEFALGPTLIFVKVNVHFPQLIRSPFRTPANVILN